jgi:hypothetical protein
MISTRIPKNHSALSRVWGGSVKEQRSSLYGWKCHQVWEESTVSSTIFSLPIFIWLLLKPDDTLFSGRASFTGINGRICQWREHLITIVYYRSRVIPWKSSSTTYSFTNSLFLSAALDLKIRFCNVFFLVHLLGASWSSVHWSRSVVVHCEQLSLSLSCHGPQHCTQG